VLNLQAKLLQRAIEICGGWAELCERLGVSEHTAKMWIDGRARMPDAVFLKAADVVLEDDIARANQDRRHAPRMTGPTGQANS